MSTGHDKLKAYYTTTINRYELERGINSKGDNIMTLKDKETGRTVTFNDDEPGKAEMLKYIKDNS